MWTDSHCHLDAREFDTDRAAVVTRARAAGVSQIVLPAVSRDNWATVRDLAHQHDLHYALGIHPLCVADADEDADLHRLAEALTEHRDDPKLVAIGEIGIDHFVPGLDPDRQSRFFVAQLKLARELGLPVIIHTRRSVDSVLKHLRAHRLSGGIAHAFNGSEQQAGVFVDLGFKLGFGGAMTFDRALQIRRLAETLPIEAIVLETDSPDIPPHWLYRSQIDRAAGATSRNEPAELPRIAETLAELRGLSLSALAATTSANVRSVLPKLR